MNRWQCADYYIIFFSPWPENCGCYDNGNSQNVATVGDLCLAGNTCALFKKNLEMCKGQIDKSAPWDYSLISKP